MTKDLASRIKIGVVTLVACALFVFMVFLISGISFAARKEIQINFSFVNSLELRAPVRFAGARVGEVKRIHILTQSERAQFPSNPPYVWVWVSVDKQVAIPKGTKALVNTMGFMGEKYVELMPAARTNDYLGEGDTLEGIDPTPMDSVFASAKKLADEMEIAAKNINTLITSMQDKLPVLIAEFEKTLATTQDLAVDAKKLATDVKKTLPDLIVQFEKTLASAQDLATDAKGLATDAKKLTSNANTILNTNRADIEHLIGNARQMTIYMKSLSHVLATRPWKIVWGGGPLPVEPEEEKFAAPPNQPSADEKKD